MENISISLPIILFCYKILKESAWTNEYLKGPCAFIKVGAPLTLLMTLLVIHLSGFDCISHYQQHYEQCVSVLNDNFLIYCADRLRAILLLVPGSMMTWKVFLVQRRLVDQHAPILVEGKYVNTLDVDGFTLVSYSRKREGSDFGYTKRFQGRPVLQGSASFLGKIFIDFKLFVGSTNTATFFKKAVKRAFSLGYHFLVVRADALYGFLENLLFLEKLSLRYAIGIATKLKAIKESIPYFEQLARNGSSKIIHISKGVAIMGLGLTNVARANEQPVFRDVVLCRRIHRRKKKGHWKIKKYYYAIVTNLDWTPRAIYKFYMQRQCIENGFKELRYHYYVNNFCKTGQESLKANELWIASKMFAMTMYKIFAQNMLSLRLRAKRRKTLLRELFENTISSVQNGKVILRRNPQHLWHLQRMFTQLEQDKFLTNPFKIRDQRA